MHDDEYESIEKKRGRRRRLTITVGEQRRELHLERVHPSGVVDCACERSAWRFAKRTALGCRCRRRSRRYGPKVAASYCHGCGYGYHPSVDERIRGRRMIRVLAREAAFERDDEFGAC